MTEQFDFDHNPVVTENYERGPRWFVPGYDASHAMAAVLLHDRIGDDGHILVVGAGGGLELSVFARECTGWKFTGVDPSAEMLRQARVRLESVGAADRVTWVEGEVEKSLKGPFDAANLLSGIELRRRGSATRDLAPHSCAIKERRAAPGHRWLLGQSSTRFEDDLRIYAAFARRNGAPSDL